MKVVLLSMNARYVHSSLGVWCLAAGVSEYSRIGHEVVVLETTINQSVDEILERIAGLMPDVLGVSTYIWNAVRVEALLKTVKESFKRVKVVMGGPEVTYNTGYWLEAGADFVLKGEGERSLPELLDALCGDGGSLDNVPGLVRRNGGVITATQESGQNNEFVNPYTRKYFSALSGKIAYIETSRGCPYNCAFCLSGGDNPRFLSLDESKKRILMLSQSGSETIKFVDRTFNCNPERAYELFEYVIGLDTDCYFHFEVAADLFDARTLSLLKTAPEGRIQLEAGLQSFYKPALEVCSRKISNDKGEENLITILDGGNIHVHVDLIAGLPLETYAAFKEGFNRAYAIGAHTLQTGFLKLLHGSKLREQAESRGLVFDKNPPYEIIENPCISAGELDEIKTAEHALQRLYNSGRFVETMAYVLNAAGLPPFDIYYKLGTVAGYKVQLDYYVYEIYKVIKTLPGVNGTELRDCMIKDWLCSMKGKNMPVFLRKPNADVRRIAAYAESVLGRKIRRCEAAEFFGGGGAFADSRNFNPVTGRYALAILGEL